MAFVSHLPEPLLIDLFHAIQNCGFEVEEILDTLPAALRASVPRSRIPNWGLVRTLRYLNECQTTDGQLPFVTFLKWLIAVVGGQRDVAILKNALSILSDGATIENVSAEETRSRGAYVGLVRRLFEQQGFEIDIGDSKSPVFVGWADARARVVGVAIGDLHRTLRMVREQTRLVSLAAVSLESYVVFPEVEPTENEREAILDCKFVPVTLAELKRQRERSDRRRASQVLDGLFSRQVAWAVEKSRQFTTNENSSFQSEKTAELLRAIVHDLCAGRMDHALLWTTDLAEMTIARSLLLTTWYSIFSAEKRAWPFHLLVDQPEVADTEEILDRTFQEQRVSIDLSAGRTLLMAEGSIPLFSCVADLQLVEVQRTVRGVRPVNRTSVVLAKGRKGTRSAGRLLGANEKRISEFQFSESK